MTHTAEQKRPAGPDPRLAPAFEALRAGKIEVARTGFAQLMHDPQCGIDAHRGLASVAWRQGQPETAVQLLRVALGQQPDHADANADLAMMLLMAGRADESLQHWERRLQATPEDSLGWHNYGKALAAAGQVERAAIAFEKALQLQPDQEKTYEVYARALSDAGRPDKAEAIWRRAIGRLPASEGSVLGLAQLMFEQSRLEECLELYRAGAQKFPNSPEMHLGLGQLIEDFGDRAGAEVEFRRALELRPGWALPVEALLTLLRKNAREEDLQAARQILDDPARPPADHANAAFGLGKALDARGDYDAAFAAWRRANEARRRQMGPFDRARAAARVDRSIKQFSKEFFEQRRDWGSPSERPVFVLGMPRSGTTLVEQILSAHPDVKGCGELTDLPRVARELPRQAGTLLQWPEAASALTRDIVLRAADDYLAGVLRKHPSDALRLVDKAPSNYLHIGLILLMFPRATIVWCRRDPRDIGVSIYSENFGLGQKHATDLGDIGFYFRQHIRLMRHWVEVAGDRITQCRYEDLIADPEAHSRRLVEATGLPWDERCLKFHEDTRPVLTPSRWQVRSPIYQAAAGRWQRYERHLQPLLEALGDDVRG